MENVYNMEKQENIVIIFLGAEDCLYLNVFTPSLDTVDMLPVSVYFASEGLKTGNISSPRSPSIKHAKQHNIVSVAVQSR